MRTIAFIRINENKIELFVIFDYIVMYLCLHRVRRLLVGELETRDGEENLADCNDNVLR